MICKYLLLITILNDPEFIFFAQSQMVSSIAMLYQYFNLGTVNEFQVLLFNTNILIQHYSFVYT